MSFLPPFHHRPVKILSWTRTGSYISVWKSDNIDCLPKILLEVNHFLFFILCLVSCISWLLVCSIKKKNSHLFYIQ